MDNTSRILKEEISRIMEALNEQMQLIEEHDKRIPQIEIDLIMENIRELYTAFKDLNKHNNRQFISPPAASAQPAEQTVVLTEIHRDTPPLSEQTVVFTEAPAGPPPAEEITEETRIPEEAPVPEEMPVEEKPPVMEEPPAVEEPVALNMRFSFKEAIRFEPVPEPEPLPEPEPEPVPVRIPDPEPPVKPAPEPIPTPAPEPEIIRRKAPELFQDAAPAPQPSLADKLREEKLTLNDRLQQERQDTSLGSRLQQNKIQEIKSAIGINEKFQFINELFAGSMQDYTMAITQLNQFRNLEEAIGYIDILKFKYNWDMNADAFRKIMDIVRRRYQ